MESNTVLLDSTGKDFCKTNNGKAGRTRRKIKINQKAITQRAATITSGRVKKPKDS